MTRTIDPNVAVAAGVTRRQAEQMLDRLAESMMEPGETFLRAYDRALETPMGRSILQTVSDAQELERGGPTTHDLEAARSQLGTGSAAAPESQYNAAAGDVRPGRRT